MEIKLIQAWLKTPVLQACVCVHLTNILISNTCLKRTIYCYIWGIILTCSTYYCVMLLVFVCLRFSHYCIRFTHFLGCWQGLNNKVSVTVYVYWSRREYGTGQQDKCKCIKSPRVQTHDSKYYVQLKPLSY